MVGDVLNRKLLRDVKGAWPQFAAAVAVVFCATTLFVSMFDVHRSMVYSRDEYYERRNFAEFFVDRVEVLNRAASGRSSKTPPSQPSVQSMSKVPDISESPSAEASRNMISAPPG